MNILLQTVLDACVSALAFYLIGFGFAFGESDQPNGFIGNALFALARYSSHFTVVGYGFWTGEMRLQVRLCALPHLGHLFPQTSSISGPLQLQQRRSPLVRWRNVSTSTLTLVRIVFRDLGDKTESFILTISPCKTELILC